MCANLLLLGGGHVHLPLIEAIPQFMAQGHHVTCVSPSPVHYYSGMGPGMLGGSYEPSEIRFPIEEMVTARGGTFVRDRAARIDPKSQSVSLESGEVLAYDVLSVNTGSTIAGTVKLRRLQSDGSVAVFHAKPIDELVEARRTFLSLLEQGPLTAAVVGGGPAAVEIAGNLRRLARSAAHEEATVELLAARGVLPGFPRMVEWCARRALTRSGVTVRTDTRVTEIDGNGMIVNGERETADLAILATGVVPSRLFAESEMIVFG